MYLQGFTNNQGLALTVLQQGLQPSPQTDEVTQFDPLRTHETNNMTHPNNKTRKKYVKFATKQVIQELKFRL